MGKLKKLTFVLIITFLICNIFMMKISVVKARDVEGTSEIDSSSSSGSHSVVNPDLYINNIQSSFIDTTEEHRIVYIFDIVLGFIRNLSVVISVIILMVIGFKYIIGSVEEKANYKQTMIPYIIGCILAVAGTTILEFIYKAVR